MTPKVTIKGIDCYGPWEEDSNCLVCGHYEADDEPVEVIYADGAENWTEVVDTLLPWADKAGIVIEELTSC